MRCFLPPPVRRLDDLLELDFLDELDLRLLDVWVAIGLTP
jgi:hypothetical protein